MVPEACAAGELPYAVHECPAPSNFLLTAPSRSRYKRELRLRVDTTAAGPLHPFADWPLAVVFLVPPTMEGIMSRFSRCVTAGLAASLTVASGCGKDPSDPPSATQSFPVTPPTKSNPNASYTVSGVAFEHTSTGQHPIAGVPLRIHSAASGGIFLDVTTDADGRYVASQVRAGAVSIAPALTSGYFAPCPSGTDALAGHATFDVHIVSAALLSATGAPPSLPTTSIYASGTVYEVTTAGMQPVAGAFVELGWSANDVSYSTTLTDASGRYLVCTTPPGTGTDVYSPLAVSKDGYVPRSLQVSLGGTTRARTFS